MAEVLIHQQTQLQQEVRAEELHIGVQVQQLWVHRVTEVEMELEELRELAEEELELLEAML